MPPTRYAPTTYGSPDLDQPPGTRAARRAAARGSARRRRDPLWARLLVMAGALLMMVSGLSIVGEKMLVQKVSDSINTISVLPQRHVSIKGAVNVLLMGIDRRNPDDPTRSDSIIILHIPASHDRAYLISIPRDSLVSIPPFPPTGYTGGKERINAAFMYGSTGKGGGLPNGFRLLATTITSFTGIQFHAGAIVDFNGFRDLVAALGGVDMCVDEKTTSIHIGIDRHGHVATPFNQDANLHLTPVPGVKPQVYYPGCQHLAPWQALDYVRQRDLIADGDYGRQRHQQQFVKAVFKEALTKGLTNPLKINSIINAVGKALTLDLGGVSVDTWVSSMGNVRDMTMIKANGGQFSSVTVNGQYAGEQITPDMLTLLRDVANDNVDDFLKTHPTWVTAS